MAQMSKPSDAAYARHPVEVPETNGQPDRTQLSNVGAASVDEILKDIYFNQYLIEDWCEEGQGDYLVHSAQLSCTKSDGSNKAFLHLSEYPDANGNRLIANLRINFEDNTIVYGPTVIYDQTRYENSQKLYFTEEEKNKLISLLEEHKFLEWLNGRYYWDLTYNEKNCDVTAYVINPNANYAKRMDFVSLNKMENFMGMGADEFWLRTNGYYGTLRYEFYNSEYFHRLDYKAYGVPDGYNELMDKLWDFVFRKIDTVDWRSVIDEGANVDMLRRYPYMGRETEGIPDYNKMWYFSINEFFSGEKSGPGASFTYSRIENNPTWEPERIFYDTWYSADLNFVDTSGSIRKYREADEWLENQWAESEYIMPSYNVELSDREKQKLAEILEKYEVTTWREPEYYQNIPEPCRIRGVGFFNLNPNKNYYGISEQEMEIRSSFETFIYLYDSDGKRLRLHYDNTGLPENYNEFREELWDFAMSYARMDWRTQLDQWGKTHLKIIQERETAGVEK